jgi:hypothetical protein
MDESRQAAPRRRASYADVASSVALVVALCGVGYAGAAGGGAGGDGVPAGAVAFLTKKSCPNGWKEYTALRGRYAVGLPQGGKAKETVGEALSDGENRAVGQHTHDVTDPGHAHGVTDPGHAHGLTDPGHVHTAQAQSAPISGQTSFPANARFHADAFDAGGTLGTMQVLPAFTGISIQSATTGVSVNSATTGITVKAAGDVPGTNAPYVQLLACKKK